MSPEGAAPQAYDRGWVREPDNRGGLRRYVNIARDHWRLMVVLLACVVGAAIIAVSVSSKTYQAEAILNVSPVSGNDTRFDGINVIRDSSVPTRDVETLARLVTTIPVAQQAAKEPGVSGSPQGLLGRVSATPIGGSFLVSVQAKGSSADQAAATANAFANGTVAVRSAQFRQQVDTLIRRLNDQISTSAGLPPATRTILDDRLAQLEALRNSNDPTVQLETPATPPASPTSPGLSLVLPIALVVGLLIAFGGAVAVDAAGSRLRTESQLGERFNLPVLARIPRPRRPGGAVQAPAAPAGAPSAAAESYRDLAQSIAVLRRDPHRPRSLLFTSAGDGENRTISAIETARTLADAGQRVILVDADLRQPSVARRLGLDAPYGTGSVMMGRVGLDEALVEVPEYRGRLSVLSGADMDGAAAVIAMSPAIVGRLLDDAASRADSDFVIFDAAPLGAVADALPIATTVDDVVIVVKRGRTELSALTRLADVLVRHGVVPRGFCLVGWARRARGRREDLRVDGGPADNGRAPSGTARLPVEADRLPRP